jgi:hypothetical protein
LEGLDGGQSFHYIQMPGFSLQDLPEFALLRGPMPSYQPQIPSTCKLLYHLMVYGIRCLLKFRGDPAVTIFRVLPGNLEQWLLQEGIPILICLSALPVVPRAFGQVQGSQTLVHPKFIAEFLDQADFFFHGQLSVKKFLSKASSTSFWPTSRSSSRIRFSKTLYWLLPPNISGPFSRNSRFH